MEKKILAKVGDKEISNIDIDNAIQGLDPYQAQQFQTEEGRKYVFFYFSHFFFESFIFIYFVVFSIHVKKFLIY